MASTIPTFYWLFFIVLDPVIALWGMYMMFFTPAVVTDAFIPASVSPYNPLQTFFQHQLGGALSMCIILDLFLLRRTNEIWIWKVQQAGQLVYDLALLYSIWYALSQQGRLSTSALRIEDWGNIAITGSCAVVRWLFCAGVGLRSPVKVVKKK